MTLTIWSASVLNLLVAEKTELLKAFCISALIFSG